MSDHLYETPTTFDPNNPADLQEMVAAITEIEAELCKLENSADPFKQTIFTLLKRLKAINQ